MPHIGHKNSKHMVCIMT
uniref:Uncharacterized protein n=1 Tax=Rhizophora mucronata TaxID=61149 RepID=A0A2P2PP65_RHIMU